MTNEQGFHTYITFTLASRDGVGWTIDWGDVMPHMIMGGSPREVIEKMMAQICPSPPVEPTTEPRYTEKDVAAITAAIDAVREEKSVTGVCVGARATLGGNDIMLLKVPSGSYGIGVSYAIRAVNRSGELAWCAVCQARMPYPHEHQTASQEK